MRVFVRLHEFCIFSTPLPIFNDIKKASELVYWGIHNLASCASSQQVDIMKKLSLFNSENLILKKRNLSLHLKALLRWCLCS